MVVGMVTFRSLLGGGSGGPPAFIFPHWSTARPNYIAPGRKTEPAPHKGSVVGLQTAFVLMFESVRLFGFSFPLLGGGSGWLGLRRLSASGCPLTGAPQVIRLRLSADWGSAGYPLQVVRWLGLRRLSAWGCPLTGAPQVIRLEVCPLTGAPQVIRFRLSADWGSAGYPLQVVRWLGLSADWGSAGYPLQVCPLTGVVRWLGLRSWMPHKKTNSSGRHSTWRPFRRKFSNRRKTISKIGMHQPNSTRHKLNLRAVNPLLTRRVSFHWLGGFSALTSVCVLPHLSGLITFSHFMRTPFLKNDAVECGSKLPVESRRFKNGKFGK